MAAAVNPWDSLLAALQAVTGGDRGLIYDVPQSDAPRPRDGARVYVDGGAAWWRFVHRRRQLDDGPLTPIVSLRPLGAEERWLVPGWGSRFTNAFLLIEPLDRGCDLTAADNRRRDGLLRLATDGASTPLLAAVRASYGQWHAADGAVSVQPGGPGETMMSLLMRHLHRRYPVSAYAAVLQALLRDEPELFTGRAAGRAVLPFLTRRGLPVVHDPNLVTEAVRMLVNRGVIRVSATGEGVSYRGPARPVPETVSASAFAELVLS